jgi:hypothetical protein
MSNKDINQHWNDAEVATPESDKEKLGPLPITLMCIALVLTTVSIFASCGPDPKAQQNEEMQEMISSFDKQDAELNEWSKMVDQQNIAAMDFLDSTLEAQELTQTTPGRTTETSQISYLTKTFQAESEQGEIFTGLTIPTFNEGANPVFSVYLKQGDDYLLLAETSEMLDPKLKP